MPSRVVFTFRDHELGLIATLGSLRVKLPPPQTEQTNKGQIQDGGVEDITFLSPTSHFDEKYIFLWTLLKPRHTLLILCIAAIVFSVLCMNTTSLSAVMMGLIVLFFEGGMLPIILESYCVGQDIM